jgi:aspartate carbamoyltransferase regulatory subunit
MHHVSFKTVVKDGYIKLPERYSQLNNENVVVEITGNSSKKKSDKVKLVEEFLRKYTGMLKNSNIPPDITIKEIREMRLKEKYGI